MKRKLIVMEMYAYGDDKQAEAEAEEIQNTYEISMTTKRV